MSSSTQPTDRRPLVICGPSGVGKGTLIQMLFQRHPDTFTLSVSHTTRAPRPGEQDGVHYHYVTKEQFQALIAEDKFVEQYVTLPKTARGTWLMDRWSPAHFTNGFR